MLDKIKKIREATALSIGEIKKALEEADGNEEKALEILRIRNGAKAVRRSGRNTKEGIVESYIHSNRKIGVLLELNCETDFVARNPDFQELAHNIAMHIAAMKPQYISAEDVPEEILDRERRLHEKELKESKKPTEIVKKIIEGKLRKYCQDICLLHQPYIKDQNITVEELLKQSIGKLGENIIVSNFVRFEV